MLGVICLCLGGCGRFGRTSALRGEAQDAGQHVPPQVAARLAELEEQLRQREQELAATRAELARLQQRAIGKTSGTSQPPPNLEPAESDQEQTQGGAAALAAQLARERQERQALLEELERLRQEVSSPFSESHVPEADYLALKQELMELRRVVQQQEQQQRDLMLKLAALPSQPPGDKGGGPDRGTTPEHVRLATETQQELALSQQRITQLEAALEVAKKQGDRAAALAAENDSLRSQLAEERRRAEALEAKLKVAARVTDLIFRMRTQEREGSHKGSAR